MPKPLRSLSFFFHHRIMNHQNSSSLYADQTHLPILLNGSFVQCLVNKIKFSDFDNELIYYNSKNYFLGNAVGDVYSHVIDLKKLKVYSAHLSVISEGRVSLDLSQNIDNPMIKNFFVSYFRRDYPNLRLVEKAI